MAVNRLTGFTSGLDTDTLVKGMLDTDQKRVDREKANRQLNIWRQEQYREIYTLMSDFKSKYFDVLNGSTNITSETMFAKFTTSVQSNGVDTNKVSIVGSSESTNLDHTISEIAQLAVKDKYTSSPISLNKIKTGTIDIGAMPDPIRFRLSIDGTVKNITVNKSDMLSQDITGFKNELQNQIEANFGADYRDIVSVDGGGLSFSKVGTDIAIFSDNTSLSALGLNSGSANYSYTPIVTGAIDVASMADPLKFNLDIDGTTHNISVAKADLTTQDADGLAKALNDKIETAFGSAYKDTVSVTDGKLSFHKDNTAITINEDSTSPASMTSLGLTTGVSSLNYGKFTSGTFNVSSMPDPMRFKLTIDGTEKSIEISKSELSSQDVTGFVDVLKDKIEANFGVSYRDIVSVDGDKIAFEKDGTKVSISQDTSSYDALNITSSSSSSGYNNKSVKELLEITNSDLDLMTINGQKLSDLGITEDTEFDDFITLVNKNAAGAKVSYDKLQGTLAVESKSEGTTNILNLSNKLKEKLKLDTGTYTAAQNAKFTMDGKVVTKTSNTFTLDGSQFTLNQTHSSSDPAIEVKLSHDTGEVKKVIEDFVKEYNKIVETITAKTNEKTYRDFPPLTDAQRKDMNEEDIKLWEDKAKSGLLKNDSLLTSMLSEMRQIMYTSVEGSDMTLYKMGIQTSNNYKENGKLVINETKLNDALENNYSDVVKLFTNKSDKKYLDSDNRTERYNESGIGSRLLDVMNNYTRTTHDKDGYKGLIVEKSGITGDTSKTNSILARAIDESDKKIKELLEFLQRQEERYYAQFARMESALTNMQNQSNSLMSQLGA